MRALTVIGVAAVLQGLPAIVPVTAQQAAAGPTAGDPTTATGAIICYREGLREGYHYGQVVPEPDATRLSRRYPRYFHEAPQPFVAPTAQEQQQRIEYWTPRPARRPGPRPVVQGAMTEELIAAVGVGKLDRIADLLNRGADVNGRDRYGTSPLYWAIATGRLDIVKLLLDRDADVLAPTGATSRTSPLAVARAGGHPEMASLLRTRGAREEEFEGDAAQSAARLNQARIEAGKEIQRHANYWGPPIMGSGWSPPSLSLIGRDWRSSSLSLRRPAYGGSVLSPQDPFVFVSWTGECYHSNAECSGMVAPFPMPRSEARAMGKRPCGNCGG